MTKKDLLHEIGRVIALLKAEQLANEALFKAEGDTEYGGAADMAELAVRLLQGIIDKEQGKDE